MGTIVVLVVLAVLAVIAVSIYNRIITLENRYENAWSQIDVQLKRRNDLVPNVVETVKGYATHEREVFDAVNSSRQAMMNAGAIAESAQAADERSGAVGRPLAGG